MQIKLKTECKIAEKKEKLSKHLKKFDFNIEENWFIHLFIFFSHFRIYFVLIAFKSALIWF